MRTVLELDGVGKHFGRRPPVLREVSLHVYRGEVVHLVGANGAGKSTLMRIAAGLLAPSAGRVRVPERVGYVPERGHLGAGLRVDEYLHAMARLRPDGAGAADLGGLVERYGLTPHRTARIPTLSKGTVKKLAVVQALLDGNDLLVLDEPTDGLDPGAVEALRADLTARARQGAAVIFSCHTHDLDHLDAATTRLALDRGSLAPAAPPVPAPGRVRVVARPARTAHVVEHVVAATASDALLAQLLGAGAHVLRVEPVDDRVAR